MLIGSIIGTRFALKYRKKNEFIIPISIIIGLAGTILAAISISSFVWILAVLERMGGFSLFPAIIVPNLMVALIVGILIGILIGIYFFLKNQRTQKKPLIDEEFYESLK